MAQSIENDARKSGMIVRRFALESLHFSKADRESYNERLRAFFVEINPLFHSELEASEPSSAAPLVQFQQQPTQQQPSVEVLRDAFELSLLEDLMLEKRRSSAPRFTSH